MAEKKVFMDSSSKATFICPKCDKAKRVDVSEYRDIQKAVKVRCRCTCGQSYMVMLERRSFYRKSTRLPGYLQMGQGSRKWEIEVRDLSRSGLQCELKEQGISIQKGDRVTLEFQLRDDSWVKRDSLIRTLSREGRVLGVEFAVSLELSPLDVA